MLNKIDIPTQEQWNDLIKLTIIDDKKAFNIPFKNITKRHGRAFRYWCRACWSINFDCLSISEFISYHDIPITFFDKQVKNYNIPIIVMENKNER